MIFKKFNQTKRPRIGMTKNIYWSNKLLVIVKLNLRNDTVMSPFFDSLSQRPFELNLIFHLLPSF